MNPVLREITAFVLFVVMGVQSVAAQIPAWWVEQNVLVPEAAPDDFAAINQGQLKALASAACQAMEGRLEGGAGNTVRSLVASWQQPGLTADDFAVVTVGQLKQVAMPFYDRLNEKSGATTYPWSSGTTADDYGVVNLGQAKMMFAFEIPRLVQVSATPPPLVVADPYINPSVVSFLTPSVSQPSWSASTPRSFNVTDIGSSTGSQDPSDNVLWAVSKVELTLNQERALWVEGKTKDSLLELKWRPGKKLRASSDPHAAEDCRAAVLEPIVPPYTEATCGCQHGTPDVFSLQWETDTEGILLGSWQSPIVGYKCDKVLNELKRGYVAVQIRVNTPVAEGSSLERHFKLTTHDPIFGESSELRNITILQGNTTGSFSALAPSGGWVEVEAAESAEDGFSPAPLSISDAAGPRYRKVGLNGIPMPDAKPHVSNENGEENEETYIDAFSAQVRHSVSDVYVTDEATLLPLSVRRDVASDSWNDRYGLHSNERPCQPFGAGWTSNVCSYVRFTYGGGAITAEVVDEMGGCQRFVRLGDRWLHDGQESRDMKSYQNELVTSLPRLEPVMVNAGAVNLEVYDTIRLKKKFGTVCDYQMISPTHLVQFMTQDRIDREGDYIIHVYARLDRVVDRMGNELDYDYPFDNTLIPDRIFDPARPGHQVLLQQRDGLVTAVRGPGGDLITYQYELKQAEVSNLPAGQGLTDFATVLSSVTKNFNVDETQGSDVVHYDYTLDQLVIEDDRDEPSNEGLPKPVNYANLEIRSITDERGGVYRFNHQRNNSVQRFTGKVYKTAMGQPMILTSVILPNNQVTTIQTTDLDGQLFHPQDNPRLKYPCASNFSAPGVRVVIIPPHLGEETAAPRYTYKFSLPETIPLIGLTTNENAFTMGYKVMTITAPDGGVESYFYDRAEVTLNRVKGFSMLLTCVRDRNGHQTRFVYGDQPDGVPFSFDDPTQEITSLVGSSGATREIVKTMAYDRVSRILKATTIKRNSTAPIVEAKTIYGIDALFRRTSETQEGKSGTVALPGGSKKSWVYGHPVFPGFITEERLDASVARAGTSTATIPGTNEVPVIVKRRVMAASAPDNPGWWRTISEVVNIGNPLSLTFTNLQDRSATTTTWSDFNGNRRAVRDARGHVTEFQYDKRNRLVKVIHPDGSYKTKAYDAHGNMVLETDEMGTRTFHEYDVLNRRIKTTLDLNLNGQPDERYTTVAVNGTTTTYNGDLVTDTTFNNFNLPVTVTDPRGVVTLHEYDVLGRLVKKTVNSTGTLKQQFSFDYKLAGVNGGREAGSSLFDMSGFKPVKVTDPRGFVTRYEYDSLYRQIREIRADGGIIHKAYDDAGLLLSVSEPSEPGANPVNLTTFTYNAKGQPQRVTYADALFTETYYTPSGHPWKKRDEAGLETQTHYNAADLPVRSISKISTTAALCPTTMTAYDLAGNVNCITDPRGNMTQQFYDNRNRLVQTLAPQVLNAAANPFVMAHPTTLTTYDVLGRVTAVTDPLGNVTQNFYDAAGRVTAVMDALNQVTQMSYDQSGAVLTTTNALDQTTTNVYDALGRLTVTTDHAGISNRFGYDLTGNRTSVKDGLNHETKFVYDAFGRLTGQTFANGDSWSYNYFAPATTATPANFLDKASQTDPGGRVTVFTYDKRHRLKTMVRTKGAAGSSESYDLDAIYSYGTIGLTAGRLTKVVNRTLGASVGTAGPVPTTVTTDYTYDKMGRVLSETCQAQIHRYEYDLAGNRTKTTLDCGSLTHVITAYYDALNRPAVLQDNNSTPSIAADDVLTGYSYDLAGRALILHQANSQTTTNTYDVLGRLKSRTLTLGGGVVLASFTWQHDAIGSVIQQQEIWAAVAGHPARTRTTVNTYDAANRLAAETITDSGSAAVTTTNTYDAAHNRVGRVVVGGADAGEWIYSYNVANQLILMSKPAGASPAVSVSYGYDANGNRQQSHRSAGGAAAQVTSYQWNAWDKLIGVNLPDGKKHSYTYDYRTRRVATAQATLGGLTAKHTAITFSGGLSVAEFERSTVTGAIGVPNVQYVRGPDMGGGVGGLLRSVRNPLSSTGWAVAPTAANPAKQRHNLSNGRGDIVAQTDSAGSLTWTASYEAYGRRTKEAGTNADKQRANTKDEDPTGLLNEGFRYRDLETGVWLSRDPAGFVDGPNLYAYVQQNPWTSFDPDGLAKEKGYRNNPREKAVTRLEVDDDNKPITRPGPNGGLEVQAHHYTDAGDRNFSWFNGPQGEPNRTAWEPAEKYGVKSPTSTSKENAEKNFRWTNLNPSVDPQKSMEAFGDAGNKPLVRGLNTAIQTTFTEGTNTVLAASGAAAGIYVLRSAANASRGLGNPFKGKTAQQIHDMFISKGFQPRGPSPATGKGGYVNPKNGRSYHIDEANSFGEPAHVDVNRLRSYNGPLEKKKYEMGGDSGS